LVLLIITALRLPHWLGDITPTWEEQHWLLVGQALSEGSEMYKDVWDTTGPIPALVYSVLHGLFGRSYLAHQVLAMVVLFIQCIIFNTTMVARKAYNETTYVPGLMYGLLGSLFFDFFTLSPLLMGLTFVLLSFRQLFSHLQSRAKDDEAILLMGMMMGIAALCYLPLGLLLIPLYLALGFFSSTIPRRYLLILYGFLLPILMSGVYYYVVDALPNFISFYFLRTIGLTIQPYASWLLIVAVVGVPLLLTLLALLRTFSYPRFINYQSRLQQIMVLWLLVGLGIILRAHHRSPMHFLIWVPPMAFFLSHYVLLIKKRRWAEVAFTVIWGSVVILSLGPVTNWLPFFPSSDSIRVSDTTLPSAYRDKSMWVIGPSVEYYQHAAGLGTVFYQPEMVAPYLGPLDRYSEIITLKEAVDNPLPEVVVDPEDHFIQMLEYFPEWKARYKKVDGHPVWALSN